MLPVSTVCVGPDATVIFADCTVSVCVTSELGEPLEVTTSLALIVLKPLPILLARTLNVIVQEPGVELLGAIGITPLFITTAEPTTLGVPPAQVVVGAGEPSNMPNPAIEAMSS